MNPDNLIDEVTDADSVDDYSNALDNIRQYNADVNAISAGHDGRTPNDLLNEAEDTLEQGLEGWNEASISELLKEAIARISDEE